MTYWTREDLAWVAGIYEGEGCLSLRDNGYKGNNKYVTMRICMTDKDILDRVARIIGMGDVKLITPPSRAGKKPMYEWKLGRWDQWYPFVMAIFQWLGERRQAKVVEAVRLWT